MLCLLHHWEASCRYPTATDSTFEHAATIGKPSQTSSGNDQALLAIRTVAYSDSAQVTTLSLSLVPFHRSTTFDYHDMQAPMCTSSMFMIIENVTLTLCYRGLRLGETGHIHIHIHMFLYAHMRCTVTSIHTS
jgi:hypothetical protein